MRLEITVRNGALTARAETETPAARNLLLDNLPALRERLAQQDIKVQHFDVDLMDQSAGRDAGAGVLLFRFLIAARETTVPAGPSRRKPATQRPSPSPTPAPHARGGAGNQLNVVI